MRKPSPEEPYIPPKRLVNKVRLALQKEYPDVSRDAIRLIAERFNE